MFQCNCLIHSPVDCVSIEQRVKLQIQLKLAVSATGSKAYTFSFLPSLVFLAPCWPLLCLIPARVNRLRVITESCICVVVASGRQIDNCIVTLAGPQLTNGER